MKSKTVFIILTVILFFISTRLWAQDTQWIKVDEGLYIGEFISPQKPIVGDSKITIIKIDPKSYKLRLLTSSELNHSKMTAKQWSKKYKLIAAINAGMFQTDHKSNVGYMKNFDHLNNSRVNSKYHSVAAFNPRDKSKPVFKIYDTDEVEITELIKSYNTVIQNLRLIKSPGHNRWSQQDKKWSEAALGQDHNGNILFIFARSPYSMHDLNNILLKLPIKLASAQHLEGGPEASLYFSYNNKEIELVGSYETGFNENENNNYYWPIPNILGIVKK